MTSRLAPELARRATAKARVLAALTEAGPRGLTNVELVTICQRFGARIFELKAEGYAISDPAAVSPGVYRYMLTVGLAEDTPVAAQEPPLRFVPPVGMPVYHDTPKAVQRSREAEQRGLF
jgi:hypothetical protein